MRTIIKNYSKQEMKALYEYLAGYETRLRDKIKVTTEVYGCETIITITDQPSQDGI